MPIAPQKAVSPKAPALEQVFGAGKRLPKRAHGAALNTQQLRGYSPSLVEQPDLNLTTEQLFRVCAEGASPQEVLKRDFLEIQLANRGAVPENSL